MYLAEPSVEAGLFASLDDPEVTISWPLAFATDTGSTTTVDGETVPIYSVQQGGQTVDLALVRNTSVGRFVGLDDATIETYAVVRTAERAESIDPQWQNFRDIIDLRDFDRSLTNTILVTILVVGWNVVHLDHGWIRVRQDSVQGTKHDVRHLHRFDHDPVRRIDHSAVPTHGVRLVGSTLSDHWYGRSSSTPTGLSCMRQFFVSIPKDLEEAAYIDGAKRWKILWSIFVPLSWPAIATLATFMFLYAWNSFIWPLVSINGANSEDFVLTIALQTLGGQAGEGPNLIFAAIVLSVIIPFTVFILAQRYFVENVATSGIK